MENKTPHSPLRICRVCGTQALTSEDLSLFTENQKNRYGRKNLCKKCRNEYLRNYYKQHPEKRPHPKNTEENKVRAKTRKKRYYEKHREQIKEKSRIRTRTKYLKTNRLDGKGYQLFIIRKRNRPDHCEICEKPYKHLMYHHWDKNDLIQKDNFVKGIWVCSACHPIAEVTDGTSRIIMKKVEKYLWLKQEINSLSQVTTFTECPRNAEDFGFNKEA